MVHCCAYVLRHMWLDTLVFQNFVLSKLFWNSQMVVNNDTTLQRKLGGISEGLSLPLKSREQLLPETHWDLHIVKPCLLYLDTNGSRLGVDVSGIDLAFIISKSDIAGIAVPAKDEAHIVAYCKNRYDAETILTRFLEFLSTLEQGKQLDFCLYTYCSVRDLVTVATLKFKSDGGFYDPAIADNETQNGRAYKWRSGTWWRCDFELDNACSLLQKGLFDKKSCAANQELVMFHWVLPGKEQKKAIPTT